MTGVQTCALPIFFAASSTGARQIEAGAPAAAFISGACLRVDGAAPNAKRIWPQVGTGRRNAAFNGFHLAQTPKVLRKEGL